MPRFTFTKHPDFEGDPAVTMTFETEHVQVLQDNIKDFVSGSGFMANDDEDDFERRLTQEDFVAKEEDYLWRDAIVSKFGKSGLSNTFNLGDK